METAFNVFVFVLFTALWVGFAWALITSQGSLDAAWSWIRSLPLILQCVVWLLFLPVVAGLWVWHTDRAFVVRLMLVEGIGFSNVYLFLPARPVREVGDLNHVADMGTVGPLTYTALLAGAAGTIPIRVLGFMPRG